MSDNSSNPSNVQALLRPKTVCIEATLTRPADTTAYAAGDAMADSTSAPTVLTFANCARENGGGGVIQSAVLIDSTGQATALDVDLVLYDTSITPTNDNAAWAPSDSDANTSVGFIAFRGTSTSGGTSKSSNNNVIDPGALSKSFKCASSSKNLYGQLVARNAYTPVSGEAFKVRLFIIQD
jgi:hypothetical protein